MKNLNFPKANSYLANLLVYAFIILPGVQISAQFDLIYENHNQGESRIIRAIADDGAGRTVVVGHFEWTLTLGSFTLTNPSEIWDGYVGKFDSNTDSWLWAKKITLVSIGSTSDIMDLAMDNTGNVYITGTYAGVVSFDNISLSSTKNGNQYTLDIFVAKYNSSGGIVWAKSLGSKAGLDMAKTIALDGSNNIFIGGMFTNKAMKCGAPSTTSDKYDVYLAKLNNAGTTLWEKRYASAVYICGTPNNCGENLTTDASGNVFLTGEFNGSVSFGSGSGLTITSVGLLDVFAAKINGSGTTQWVKAIGGSAYDYGNAILPDASGNVYVGGAIGDATGFSVVFLSKYSPTGNLVWSVNPYPTSPSFASNALNRIIPATNSILVSDARAGLKTIALLDGSVISSDSLIGNGFTYPPATGYVSIMDLAPAGTGYVFAALGKCGTVSIGSTSLVSSNNCPFTGIWRDLFIVRKDGVPPPPFQIANNITDPLASFHEFAEKEFAVYPNPAKDNLHVTLPVSEKEISLLIQNQFGQTVWSEKFESQRRSATITLNGNNFQSGIYYLICLSNGEVKTKRFVIEK